MASHSGFRAQRFNHSNFGNSHPAPAPAPRMQARPEPARPEPARQAPVRPAPARNPEPVVVENRSINGGSRNIGSHDYNASRGPVVAARPAPAARENPRDHVNVYHTGGYRGVHPYYYHPYRPYFWGPTWHPLGYILSSLAADAILLSIANQQYYYDNGCFYVPGNSGYSVVPAPIGALIPSLPPGYETCQVGNDYYYYFGGAFYINVDQGFQVVAAPVGAVVSQIPVGAQEVDVNGETLLVYNNTYYQPVSQAVRPPRQ